MQQSSLLPSLEYHIVARMDVLG